MRSASHRITFEKSQASGEITAASFRSRLETNKNGDRIVHAHQTYSGPPLDLVVFTEDGKWITGPHPVDFTEDNRFPLNLNLSEASPTVARNLSSAILCFVDPEGCPLNPAIKPDYLGYHRVSA